MRPTARSDAELTGLAAISYLLLCGRRTPPMGTAAAILAPLELSADFALVQRGLEILQGQFKNIHKEEDAREVRSWSSGKRSAIHRPVAGERAIVSTRS